MCLGACGGLQFKENVFGLYLWQSVRKSVLRSMAPVTCHHGQSRCAESECAFTEEIDPPTNELHTQQY